MSPSDSGHNLSSDHDRESIERRLDAVERALSEDEPVERTDRLDELDARVAELEAAVQALRGYVGSVRAVNEDVERRADRAFRKARAVERTVAPGEQSDRPPNDENGREESPPADDDHPLDRLRRRL